MTVNGPVTDVQGVGQALAKKFALLGIKTVADLIDYYPRRYEDYSVLTPIGLLKPGIVTVQAVIKSAEGEYRRRGMHITEAIASDKTGNTRVIWFNQPYRKGSIKYGHQYFMSGQYKLSHQHFSILNPAMELVSEFPLNTARIVPIYNQTKGLNSNRIRATLKHVLPLIESLPETLPEWLTKDRGLLSRSAAVMAIHFPDSSEQLFKAQYRLGLEEVFQLNLASLLNKKENQLQHSLIIPYNELLAVKFSKSLPFRLTDEQRLAVKRIYNDMERAWPMARLLEGDVGSGKTVVAAMAAIMALEQGYQVALMAPTEILAKQHFDTMRNLLKPVGLEKHIGLLTGSLGSTQRTHVRQAVADGLIKFIIGTQSLIQEHVDIHQLALTIVDEQHRFGVEQRKRLLKKAGHMPHMLNLTATPIPRSLARMLYGELDVTRLEAKPAGRQPVKTEIISPNSRTQLYSKIEEELKARRQMFVVCPTIYELDGSTSNSAEEVYERMSKKDFKKWHVGLLHGKLKSTEKNKIMNQFAEHKLDILVTTTVIEVGVDIPNATVMLIESPERFGLAQIHQLRGRVGRGSHKAYCYLMMSDSSTPSRRLRALESSSNGFHLAELDLKIRGPGALMVGTRQHGHKAAFKVADLANAELLDDARRAANEFLNKEELTNYPDLASTISLLREAVYAD